LMSRAGHVISWLAADLFCVHFPPCGLLVHRMNANEAKARHAQLVDELRQHDHAYYVLAQPTISDREYDRLYQALLDLENEHPRLISPESPSQRVGGQPVEGFTRVKHLLPMLSLEKLKASKHPDEKEEPDVERRKRLQDENTLAELKAFDMTLQKLLGKRLIEYLVEPKVDGVSIGVHYRHGKLALGVTRGDGSTGDDITSNIKTIGGIPLELRLRNPPALLEVRGEAYISKPDFEALNDKLEASGDRPFPNARNATAGTLKQLDPRMVTQRPIRAVFYAVGACEGIRFVTHAEVLESLKKFGLPTQAQWWLCNGVEEVLKCYDSQIVCSYDEARDLRSRVPYDIDGIVLKVNDLNDWQRIPAKAKAPGYAIVHKPIPWITPAETVLNAITVQVGRTGVLTPVAELEPVFIQGSTVSRATLHNEDEIRRKDIRIGDTVRVRKAGMVIPEVYEVVKELRPPDAQEFDLFKQVRGKCPACGEPIVRDPQFVAWRCQNIADCPAQSVRRLEFMAQRSALDIEGLGGVVAQKLIESGLVKEPFDMFTLTPSKLASLNLGTKDETRAFGEKNAVKVIEALNRAKSFSLSRWLLAIGIPNVGEITAYQMARLHRDFEDLSASGVLTGVVEIDRLRQLLIKANPRGRKHVGGDKGDLERGYLQIKAEFRQALRALMSEISKRARQNSQIMAEVKEERTGLEGELSEAQSEAKKLEHEIDRFKQKSEKPSKGLRPKLTETKSEMLRLEERIAKAGIPEGIGPVVAESIRRFLDSRIGRRLLERLGELGIHPRGGLAGATSEEPGTTYPLMGKTLVLTGTLKSLSRDKAAEEIRNRGGNVTNSVTKNTAFLVVGEEPGATKTNQAKALGVKELTEEQFLAMLKLETKAKSIGQQTLF
jgi:DNA ligase (NAD+)